MQTKKQKKARMRNWNLYMLNQYAGGILSILKKYPLRRTVSQHLKLALIELRTAIEEYKSQTD